LLNEFHSSVGGYASEKIISFAFLKADHIMGVHATSK